ncbi:MAG: SDR family oxidoreductase [Chloroflexi bacterium]|nr:SDR family oxidoreductase [Chloroflexota bacterium]
MTRKTALVSGASGGIGYELSKLFAADGYDLVLVARSEQKLDKIAASLCKTYGVNAIVIPKDLSNPASPNEILASLEAQSTTIDVLVNNAGFGIHGPFAETDLVEELNMLQLNIVSLTHLTKLFLPGMIERGQGHILNVGSTGSFQPGPLMATYCASKAYVLNFSEAIAEELRGTGVSVTALCPGVTRTGFQARAHVENTPLIRSGSMSAARVAEIGYKALMRGKRVVVPGLTNWLVAFSVRLTPRSWVTRLGYKLMEPVKI